uniref:hypothetical protein n=1 Tax=Roseivirga sp. TaxID=1964215 RepID=UPI004048E9F0
FKRPLNANWGTNMVESPTVPGGNVLFSPMTGATVVSFGTFPSVSYPVQQLYPVTSSGGTTLLAGIKAAIS